MDKTKREIGGLSYPVSRISGGRHPWVWRVHEDASCQVPRVSGGCRAPFNKARDPYEDIYCVKRKTCPRYKILGNRRDVQSLSFQFRIGKSTVSQIVMEVCDAIYQVLGRQHLKTPNTVENWREIATLFYYKWNIPNNIGAIDGKRILIQKPPNAGSHFHDYKGNESFIALIMSGPSYECLYADVGTNGRNSDGHAWARCSLKKALDSPDNPLNIPPPCPLPGAGKAVPFVIKAEEAFCLASYMLKPYPRKSLTVEERIANYRISRGRRISENILEILANRWRCFRAPLPFEPCQGTENNDGRTNASQLAEQRQNQQECVLPSRSDRQRKSCNRGNHSRNLERRLSFRIACIPSAIP